MTADLRKAPAAAPGEGKSLGTPPRKDASNPQQGMSDSAPAAASLGAGTAVTATTNTACTSPLTVTSLEAAAVAAAAAGGDVPDVVARVVQAESPPPDPEAAVDPVLAPMAGLALAAAPSPAAPEEKKRAPAHVMHFHRTLPTEHDERKLFVGGLPTDVTDHEFLEFFKGFGEVIDSVVMVDRVTKRSRGFGFVTFASEEDAAALLTAIPGKTGFVLINGKQCEVKASTPKVGDGPPKFRHHVGGGTGSIGLWRSDHHQRHPPSFVGPGVAGAGSQKKHFYIDSDFNGDVDGRNFDEIYSQQQPPPQSPRQVSVGGYQQHVTDSSPFRGGQSSYQAAYYPNYQGVYPSPSANGGYTYSGNGYSGGVASAASASVPSSWESSYPGQTGQGYGYGQYPGAASGSANYGSYAPHHYSNSYYAGHYGGGSAPHSTGGYGGYHTVSQTGGGQTPSPGAASGGDGGGDDYFARQGAEDYDRAHEQY